MKPTIRRKLLPTFNFNPGDRTKLEDEPVIHGLKFKRYKFTSRRQPSKKNVVIFPIFAEFGSELLLPLYCLPRLLQTRYSGKYTIVMGWHGRGYLYKHLVDEFWELDAEHHNLREYCRAFHHDSKTLKQVEKHVSEFGHVVPDNDFAVMVTYPKLEKCPLTLAGLPCRGQVVQQDGEQYCTKCRVTLPDPGIYWDVDRYRKEAVWLPSPSPEKLEEASRLVPENAVAITARGRKCYGRNLQPEFYERLIYLLEDMGYSPVWMGEKATSQKCPCPRITDLSQNYCDLELSLAIVSKMKFTVQFWTASTRLAGMMGTPFLLFESPDQIWGSAQEGYRLSLCTKGEKKLVAAHFLDVLENNSKALKIVEQAILEMEENNFNSIVGMVRNAEYTGALMEQNKVKKGLCQKSLVT